MNKTTCAVVLLAVFSSLLRSEEVKVRQTAVGIEIETAALRQVIRCSSTTPGVVMLQSLYLKSQRREMLAPTKPLPWFELCVNGSIVTSSQPIWRCVTHSRELLANSGRAVRLNFLRDDGLQVVVVLQFFPGSTLCRQRMEVSAPTGTFRLSMSEGKLHLVFPSYGIAEEQKSPTTLEEVHLAKWLGEDNAGSDRDIASGDRPDEPASRLGKNLRQNYMYHPLRRQWEIAPGTGRSFDGQVLFLRSTRTQAGMMLVYEHDSPAQDSASQCCVLDVSRSDVRLDLRYRIQAGAYTDGQPITPDEPLTTGWVTLGFHGEDNAQQGEAMLRDMLRFWITDNPSSRQPLFYYNTWGMQRDESLKGKDVRAVLTEARACEEARFAAELGAELFVLDDGWQEHFGDWTPHPTKFPDGLRPLKRQLDTLGMTFGLWLGALAADSNSVLVRQHPEWLIRDNAGKPIRGRWDRQVMCFVSDYRKYFLEVCRRLNDQGVRYFKWDGLDYHPCSSPYHQHGGTTCTAEERIARHRYELIRAITAAAHELHRHQENVVVEFDVTEPNRSVGLTFLSEGKYFWMNNGASWYGDYSPYRAKSTRAVPMSYASFFPLGLQTYASYPHQHQTWNAQRYNVNSSIIWGRGFWGDLSKMAPNERRSVGNVVANIKRVTPSILSISPEIYGKIGATPEIYSLVNRGKAEGAIIAFSGSATDMSYQIKNVRADSLLAVVRSPFRLEGSTLTVLLEFTMPDVSREAFLFSNHGTGIRISASTSWLKDAQLLGPRILRFSAAAGEHEVRWSARNGIPTVTSPPQARFSVKKQKGGTEYVIEVETVGAHTEVEISGGDEGAEAKKRR